MEDIFTLFYNFFEGIVGLFDGDLRGFGHGAVTDHVKKFLWRKRVLSGAVVFFVADQIGQSQEVNIV